MNKRNSFMVFGIIVGFVLGFANLASAQTSTKFKVRVENVSGGEQVNLSGTKYPFALSPGMFGVSEREMPIFKPGHKASAGLEMQAEDGNPSGLVDGLKTKLGSVNLGVFNTPVGASGPSPILPGGAYEFEFMASAGMKLTVVAMYGQSNDLFYAPESAIKLFEKGKPISGDITGKFLLWDAGTEINQEPGTGADQAPRQKAANTGAAENGTVRLVGDGFKYPDTRSVLRVTITPIS